MTPDAASPTIPLMPDRNPASSPDLRPDDVLQVEALRRTGRVEHAFFTRSGGVSAGLYRSLNVGAGSSDVAADVAENRARAARFLGRADGALATPWQIHSPDVAVVDAPFGAERPKADGVVTRVRGLPIGVVTADCGPVLFNDAEAGVIGTAHAGWRGALGGVLDRTVEAMEGLGARRERITAVLGPTITQPNYEVDAGMMEPFLAEDGDNARFFAPGRSEGKRQFDLPAYIVAKLARLGTDASFVDTCTYADEARFYSFRRTTHRGEPDYGRQLSAIVLL
ncbi:peptidoglycan editing factor PgeF [Aureimonas sp. AU40]|uniref:peptidoglycan editing factor PgeF n=1 Tax=Aureimonas sp. AU40 TaxID=1637747 RepID=UPI000AF554B0|nr:peptidoglycan editing factor PgeF [Aureimonas sp. AU40]